MNPQAELVWQMPFGALGWVLGILLGLVVLVVGALSSAGRPWPLRIALVALRTLTVVAVLFLMARPEVRRADATLSRDRLVLLVDVSASMGLPGQGGVTRVRAAQRWLAAAQPGLERLRARHQVEVLCLDARLEPWRGPGKELPDGRSTDLMAGLEALRARIPGRQLAGVVLVSDGRDTEGLRDGVDPGSAARLAALDLPVNVVPVGDTALVDAAVTEVKTDDLAFVRNVARVSASLRVVGTLTPVEVDLWLDGALAQTRTVTGSEDREVVFEVVHGRVGDVAARVSVRPLTGEATLANNSRRFVVRVVRDRVRILQIAGRPSWDVRFLRQHFKRDPNVDLVSFFILRTHRSVSNAAPHEMSLIQFPAEELFSTHLDGFDLVVMQDFERYPPYVGSYLDKIAAWVRRGGALALTGGEHSLSLGGYVGTPLAAVLPVELLPEGAPSTLLDMEEFRPRWTSLASSHPVTRGGVGDGLSPAALASLSPLEGINKVVGAHRDAAVLAEHPRLAGADGRSLPVLAVRDVEAGRSLALLTDTSWHWRFAAEGEGAGAYDSFWRRAVRYLIGDGEFGRLRVLAAHTPYASGAPISLSVLVSDIRRQPQSGVEVSWRLLGLEGERAPGATGASGPVEVREGRGTTDGDGRLRLDLGALAPGTYRAEATALLDGRKEEATRVIVTEGSAAELARVEPAPDVLAAVARTTGGRVLRDPGDLSRLAHHPPRVVALDRVRTEPLVGSLWLLFGIIVLALGSEWLLRRRVALL